MAITFELRVAGTLELGPERGSGPDNAAVQQEHKAPPARRRRGEEDRDKYGRYAWTITT